MSIEGKIALVTGASGGIGSVIALTLAKMGAVVVGTGITDQCLENINGMFQAEGLNGYAVLMDVTKKDSIEETIQSIQSKSGSIEILINNAGITSDNLMLRMKDEEWERVIAVNLDSIYRVTKACLKDMVKARWGRVVSISSVVGVAGNPGQANYAASKAGMIGFSKSLAYEVASRGVTVNCIAPGFIDSPMTQRLTDDQKAAILSRIPMGRLGTANDIAEAVGFLVSPSADYITGQTLHVNGGMLMV
ncbi:MAG: 3-oxoacyl-ACP reductase FabG [Gammaproteobacteria bacterium]|nr:3-oxoacyl-ACP reductase FabG [Gammaproteobacteria bacterium]